MSFSGPRLKTSREDSGGPTTASVTLINPPYSSVDLNFSGNQNVSISVQNNNVLGVMGNLSCNIGFYDTKGYVLPPFGSVSYRYDMFGEVPISWSFTISTISDAANVSLNASWNPF